MQSNSACTGLLRGDDRGIEFLRESVAVASRHVRDYRLEAREHLSVGMELASRCGAERLLARANDELHASGERPRRTARSGVKAFTASELRVERLAAEGRSNVEIAQELYLSVKTGETHLSNAYSKLGPAGDAEVVIASITHSLPTEQSSGSR